MIDLTSKAERAMILGEIIDAWTEVEQALFRLFWVLLGGRSHIKAQALFMSVRGLKEQMEMTEALARVVLGESGSEKLIAIFKEVTTASAKRNKIVHGVWQEKGTRKTIEGLRLA